MKRVLVTGAHGYIGTKLTEYLKMDSEISVDGISLQGDEWEHTDFSLYDSIIHLAGIVHRKETDENKQLYYDINRDLSVQVAKKAKHEHVRQFIFMSTMGVYGKNSGAITIDSIPDPKTNYGKSKLQAEEQIQKLENDQFAVCIVRPPMVYGPGCKGNYQMLLKMAQCLPVFPRVDNTRSMIYIDNLCEFLKQCVLALRGGTYCPQNRECVRTDEIVVLSAKCLGRKVYLSYLLGAAVCCLRPFVKAAEKAFGTFVFEDKNDDFSYCVVDNTESILRSARKTA